MGVEGWFSQVEDIASTDLHVHIIHASPNDNPSILVEASQHVGK